MSNAALKTLRETLKRGSFDSVYYICGEDDFQKEDAVKQLIASAMDPSVRDFNLDVCRAQELDSKSFDAVISSMPMMAERRMVIIKDTGSLKKNARSAVERYLEKPATEVVLILVEEAGGKTDREFSRLATLLEFDFLTADRIPRWISHYVTTELKTAISAGAVELLQEAVGSDLYQLVSELEKLAGFANPGEITEASVSAVVGVRRGETMVDLLDAVARRDLDKALTLVNQVLTQPKTTAVSVVMALTAQTLALAWGKAKLEEGFPQGRLQGEYYNLLKQSGSVFTGRPWGSAISAWTAAANSWEIKSLEHALDILLTADVILKETRFSSEEQTLATLILAICSGDERRIAA